MTSPFTAGAVLVDTSSWVHFLTPNGDADVRARVEAALAAGAARWCPIIRLELWTGAAGSREKKVLREFERDLPELPITDAVWDAACALAQRCRTSGVTVPATDVLVYACAQYHEAALEHADADFEQIRRLGEG